MNINGRDVKFYYSVGAFCSYNDWAVLHPKVSSSTANIILAVAMNAAWHEAHPEDESKPLAEDEIRALPVSDYFLLMQEVQKQQKTDMAATVETVPAKGKKKTE